MVPDGNGGMEKRATQKGNNTKFGQTKGESVAGAMAREEAAKEAVDGAATEKAAAAAKENLDDATKRRKLTETARADQAKDGKIGGKERGSKKGRTNHARGGTGFRRKITLSHLLRPRPESIVTSLVYFKCPKGCDRVDPVEDRWFSDVCQEEWRYVEPVCQLREVHAVAEMAPCRDAEGLRGYNAEDTKALPFFGNKPASIVVQKNQGAYAVRLEEERRYLEYGTETESDVDLNDAQTYYQEGCLWREGSGLASMSLVDLCSQIHPDPFEEGASGSLVES